MKKVITRKINPNEDMNTYTSNINKEFKKVLDTFDELKKAIDEYIEFYNTRRLQGKLKGMTPIEYRNHTLVT